MPKIKVFNRLSVRLTAAFLLAAVIGVALVSVLAYRNTSSGFRAFIDHIESMPDMMGGMMGGAANDAALVFIQNMGQTLWIASLFGVVLALFLGWLFTRHIVSPLGEVAAAARRVAEGDLGQRVKVRGSNELSDLGESFNSMAEILSNDRKLRQNMVADIAHELRTPLSVLQANIEAMQDGVLEPNAVNLDSLHQETSMLERLIDDLRTLSLAESGQLEFHSKPIDLKKLSSLIIERMKTQFTSKNIDLILKVAGSPNPVFADPDRIEQVMSNLLSNAYRYTPEGGRVTLRVATDGEDVVTSVTDTGAGIPPEDLPHIFERFYRVDQSRTRRTGGSGLGLTIVKQLVEAQQGSVWVTSEPGEGTTFFFRLPSTLRRY